MVNVTLFECCLANRVHYAALVYVNARAEPQRGDHVASARINSCHINAPLGDRFNTS